MQLQFGELRHVMVHPNWSGQRKDPARHCLDGQSVRKVSERQSQAFHQARKKFLVRSDLTRNKFALRHYYLRWYAPFGFDLHGYLSNHAHSQLYAPPGPPPAHVACLDPEGTVAGLSAPLLFPNGCFLTEDGRTMILAETLALRLVALPVHADGTLGPAQPWAPLVSPILWRALNSGGLVGRVTRRISQLLDHPVLAARSSSPIAPDGIAPGDGETVWVANALRGECVRIARGGRVLDRVATSGPTLGVLQAGEDGRTLYAATVLSDDPAEARKLRRGRVEIHRLTD